MNNNSSNSSEELGNTILTLSPKKTQISPSKRWCFTLNNYTEEDISSIVPLFKNMVNLGVFNKEVGEEMTKLFEVKCKWDCRKIYWRYGDTNIGKTQFAKWLAVHLGACIIGGSHKHMLAQVQSAKAPIYVILLSYGDDEVSYRAIEQIKDGLFTSAFGCDNNKMEITDAPHLLVIGNEPPNVLNRNFHKGKYDVKEIDI